MHDRFGNLLQVGDEVILRGKITDTQSSPTYCNITVVADVSMNRNYETGENIAPYTLALNAGQVEKCFPVNTNISEGVPHE